MSETATQEQPYDANRMTALDLAIRHLADRARPDEVVKAARLYYEFLIEKV